MSQIVVLGFGGEFIAEGMQKTFESMQERELLDLEDMVVVSKNINGGLELKQVLKPAPTGKYAGRGSLVGLIAGVLLGGPILGLAGGAAVGAVMGANKDYGIDDSFIKQVSQGLRPQSSAIFLLVNEANGPEVLSELKSLGGEGWVISSTLDKDAEKRLEAALNAK